MKAKINNTLIKKLSPVDKEYEVHDTDLKGFEEAAIVSFHPWQDAGIVLSGEPVKLLSKSP